MGENKGPSQFKPEESPALSPLLAEAEAAEEVLAWETNADQQMEREHNHEIHGLRLVHAWLLFGLTVVWVIVIWVVILLQGFGGWYFPLPPWFKRIPFELSDAVLIAFMTTTTATVLGLYGIAAYWLYGKPRKDAKAGRKRK